VFISIIFANTDQRGSYITPVFSKAAVAETAAASVAAVAADVDYCNKYVYVHVPARHIPDGCQNDMENINVKQRQAL